MQEEPARFDIPKRPRVSIYDLPKIPAGCDSVCVYNKDGICDYPSINKANSDATCHKESNRALLKRLVKLK